MAAPSGYLTRTMMAVMIKATAPITARIKVFGEARKRIILVEFELGFINRSS